MSPSENPRHLAALASLHAAIAARDRVTRPAPVVRADPRGRRLVLSLERA